MSDAAGSDIGDRLYDLVETYAAFGEHRTATAVDATTSAWFAAELDARGAATETLRYDFEAYRCEAMITVDGRQLDSLPLYYGAVDSVDTDDPAVAELEFVAGLVPTDVDQLVASSVGSHPAIVVATRGRGDRLVALNREPEVRAGTPAVLVAGRELEALRDGTVRLRWTARLEAASSANIVGRFGDPVDDPLVILTPLSGWFACAGERGTGIAVALELAAALAEEGPVVVAGTTGHELEYLGVRHLLPALSARVPAPRAVVHLGACVGAGELTENRELRAPTFRLAMTDHCEERDAALADVLGPVGYDVVPGPDVWPGEGEAIRAFGAPTLSLISTVERMHTRDDVANETTSPARLTDAYAAVEAAARALTP